MYDDPRPGDDVVYPRSPTRQPYRGPRRTHRATGRVEIWVEGRGYVPEGSREALPAVDREWFDTAQSGLRTARRNAALARSFVQQNARTATGGLEGLPVPIQLQSAGRQRLEGLTNQMVRANIQPGQAGTMNSIVEQMLARQQYPSAETYGRVNTQRAIGLLVDAAEAEQMLAEAEDWARDNRGLHGFELHWTRNRSAAVREAARQRVAADFFERYATAEQRLAANRRRAAQLRGGGR